MTEGGVLARQAHRCRSANDQQLLEISVALFADAAEPLLATELWGFGVSPSKAANCRPRVEERSIGHGRGDGRRDDRTGARDGGKLAARLDVVQRPHHCTATLVQGSFTRSRHRTNWVGISNVLNCRRATSALQFISLRVPVSDAALRLKSST